jgi:Fibronectin type III domain
MAETVNLPGLGTVRKPYVWGGAAVVTLIVGVAWYKHSQNSAANAAAASTAAAGTASAAASAPIDPETGYPEGSPEDLAALQELEGSYGDVDDVGDTGTGAAGELYYDPADGLYDLTSPYVASTAASSAANTGPGTFTDNAYWTQYAIENVQGYSGSDIQTALALYLSGGALTTTQMSIYQAAVAVAGPAPDPPATAAHLTSGGSGTATVPAGTAPPAPAGLKATLASPTDVHVTWTASSGATSYSFQCTPKDNAAHNIGNRTEYSVGGLKKKTAYTARVAAVNGQGTSSYATVSFTSGS